MKPKLYHCPTCGKAMMKAQSFKDGWLCPDNCGRIYAGHDLELAAEAKAEDQFQRDTLMLPKAHQCTHTKSLYIVTGMAGHFRKTRKPYRAIEAAVQGLRVRAYLRHVTEREAAKRIMNAEIARRNKELKKLTGS